MTTQPLTIQLPEPLYNQYKARAAQSERSVEEETLEVLATAAPINGALPTELADELESVKKADDAELQKMATSTLPKRTSARLSVLHAKQHKEGLTGAESQELAALVSEYERHMLRRAQAAAVLKQRGHDVDKLITK